jgi:hypothetical protein
MVERDDSCRRNSLTILTTFIVEEEEKTIASALEVRIVPVPLS